MMWMLEIKSTSTGRAASAFNYGDDSQTFGIVFSYDKKKPVLAVWLTCSLLTQLVPSFLTPQSLISPYSPTYLIKCRHVHCRGFKHWFITYCLGNFCYSSEFSEKFPYLFWDYNIITTFLPSLSFIQSSHSLLSFFQIHGLFAHLCHIH